VNADGEIQLFTAEDAEDAEENQESHGKVFISKRRINGCSTDLILESVYFQVLPPRPLTII
jgi:hypothetical protein